MPNMIVFAGPAGGGKSTLSKQISKMLPGKTILISIDDYVSDLYISNQFINHLLRYLFGNVYIESNKKNINKDYLLDMFLEYPDKFKLIRQYIDHELCKKLKYCRANYDNIIVDCSNWFDFYECSNELKDIAQVIWVEADDNERFNKLAFRIASAEKAKKIFKLQKDHLTYPRSYTDICMNIFNSYEEDNSYTIKIIMDNINVDTPSL